MLYIIIIGLVYWAICGFRIKSRIKILGKMQNIENLQVEFEENQSYFVMVEGMQFLELENYLKLARKNKYEKVQGIILNQEQYFKADNYGNNFILTLNITMLPCIIRCVNSKRYIIYDVDGTKEREVVLNG